jgi:biotin-(acetyl-CoA carboxylase) ligase
MVLKYKKSVCVISKKQTFSTGTTNKKWLTGFGSLSISSIKLLQSSFFNYLYIMLSVCILSILRDQLAIIELKWPNDIFLVKKKYSTLRKKAIGTLMFFSKVKTKAVLVIGIGINVNVLHSPFKYIYNKHITVLFYRHNTKLLKKYICKYLLLRFSRRLTSHKINYYLVSQLNKKNKMVTLRNNVFFYIYNVKGHQEIKYNLILDVAENNLVITLNSRYRLKYLKYLKIQYIN